MLYLTETKETQITQVNKCRSVRSICTVGSQKINFKSPTRNKLASNLKLSARLLCLTVISPYRFVFVNAYIISYSIGSLILPTKHKTVEKIILKKQEITKLSRHRDYDFQVGFNIRNGSYVKAL